MTRALITQMLEALELHRHDNNSAIAEEKYHEARDAAREYLTAPEQLKVVAKFQCPKCDHEQSYGNVRCHNCDRNYEVDAVASEQSEPVGYVYSQDGRKEGCIQDSSVPNGTPLYTHPAPQPTELTDADLNNLFFHSVSPNWTKRDDVTVAVFRKFARAVLAAQRSKT